MRPIYFFILAILMLPTRSPAAEIATTGSPSLGRMVLGMLVVLAVMAGLAWFAKKLLPKQGFANGVIKPVGNLHLGPRERVVVLEVAGRWVVVGLNGSQMTALADLQAPIANLHAETAASSQQNPTAQTEHGSFAQRLQSAMQDSMNKVLKPNKP